LESVTQGASSLGTCFLLQTNSYYMQFS